MTLASRPLLRLPLLACLLVAALTAPPAAQAAERQQSTVQLSYTCRVAGVADPATVGLMFQIDAPASVAPGESVDVSGSVTLRLPENVRAAASYANITAVEGYSDTFTVPVTIGGQTAVVRTSRLVAPRNSVGNPLTVHASFTVNSFTVPTGATGQVVVAGPRNGTVTSPRQDLEPKMVAFTAMATAYGDTGAQSIGLFCYDTGGAGNPLTTIPISTDGTDDAEAAPGSTAATADAAPETPTVVATPAPSGEAESEAKDNAATFRVAAQDVAQEGPLSGRLVPLLAALLLLLALYGVLAWSRVRTARRLDADQ
ncbi:DUF6801 domain-containing protein [Aeromicrobium sp.]|uniref:DUF6801 domain-containing protein n=1 Tax=Aeromicrobium sp. TaxID=1871063 RepID=UPI0039E3F58B